MKAAVLAVAAVLLALERVCYVWAWRYPRSFREFCESPGLSLLGPPVAALQKLFYGFKVIQLGVFFGWCLIFGQGRLVAAGASVYAFVMGGLLIATGQVLNFSVFYRLGETGVFYGNRFGYEVPWSTEFPFSLVKHPQYLGAVMSIWGFFLATRFPHPDWSLLPWLETLYYIVGAYLEQ
jgi:phosphatidyl-N-methylethanolamine N-methyltransferase